MKKLLSLLLVLALTMGLATAAFAAAGTYEDPHLLTCDGESVTVTVEAAATVYFSVDVYNGSVVSVSSTGNTYMIGYGHDVVYADMGGNATLTMVEYSGEFNIYNSGEAAIDVTVSVVSGTAEDTSGTREDPIVLDDVGYVTTSVEAADMHAGGNSVYYQYVAPATGRLTLYFYGAYINDIPDESIEADIIIDNLNSYANRTLFADGVVDEYGNASVSMDVTEGDVLMIQACTLPDANWNYPAADLVWGGSCAGTLDNPIRINGTESEEGVPAGRTYYFALNAVDNKISVTGENFEVIHNGETLTPVDGVVEFVLAADPMMWMGGSFAIVNKGEANAAYAVKVHYPLGSMMNPDEAVVPGSVGCSIAENSDGYYLTWTAPSDGTLYAWLQEFPEGVDVDIVLYNTNSYEQNGLWSYDENWNDIQLEYVELAVSAGDVVEIHIMTRYNPELNLQPAAENVKIGLSMNLDDMNPSTGDAGILMAVATMIASLGSTVALVAKKKEF